MYDIDRSFHGAFSQLASEAYNVGYELSIIDYRPNKSIQLKLEPKEEMLPNVSIYPEYDPTKRCYYWNCKVTFPAIDMRKENYYDSCEYYVNKFKKCAKLITRIQAGYYCPEDYEE